jgi:hypothetical protein
VKFSDSSGLSSWLPERWLRELTLALQALKLAIRPARTSISQRIQSVRVFERSTPSS